MNKISEFLYKENSSKKKHDNKENNNDKYLNKNKNNNKEERNDKNNNNIVNFNINNNNKDNKEEELYFAEVETIIPIDEKINNIAIYNITIKSSLNGNDTWTKPCSLDDLIKFRDELLKYTNSVINIPFPTKSLFRFIPYIGEKYDERNWDILLENKFLLDNFFSTICKDKEMYKFHGFIKFFSKPSIKKNSTKLLFN